jgi:NADPH-dependent ferric siderophore reductase
MPSTRLPQSRTTSTPEVRRRESLPPGSASIALGGPALRDLAATGADIRTVVTPPGRRIHWSSRDDPTQRPGTAALEAVRDATMPPGPLYAWVAGESRPATSVRRHGWATPG